MLRLKETEIQMGKDSLTRYLFVVAYISRYREDGSSSIYIGGRRNWRNNNPGNIGYGNGKLVTKLGAIGKAGGFAVFPDYETGRRAIFSVLKKDDFQGRTVSKAIEVWAPKEHGNNTELYKKHVQAWTQIDLTRQVNSLSDEELEKLVKALKEKRALDQEK